MASVLLRPVLLAVLSWSGGWLGAQSSFPSPPFAGGLPGNAAISMPVRWSQGTVQVLVEQSLLPPQLGGASIRGLRLRRPGFLGEPAYAGVTRSLEVSACFTPLRADQLGVDLATNRPANLQVVAPAAALAIAATPAGGPGDAVGGDLLVVAFATPLPVVAGNLFLEIRALDAPFAVGTDHWVDAVWTPGGNDIGHAFAVGNGGCTSRSTPLLLQWTGAGPPRVGGSLVVGMTGAQPGALVWTLVGLDPQARPPGPAFPGFGGSLASLGLVGCHAWVPADGVVAGSATAGGALAYSITLPAGIVVPGSRIGVQMAVLDPTANATGVATTNGVVAVPDSLGIGRRCATVLAPGTSQVSPWAPYLGLMPILGLDT